MTDASADEAVYRVVFNRFLARPYGNAVDRPPRSMRSFQETRSFAEADDDSEEAPSGGGG